MPPLFAPVQPLNPTTGNTFLPGGQSGPSFAVGPTGSVGQSFVDVTLTSAQLLALLGTPITLIPAPGVGLKIMVDLLLIRYFGGTVAYTDAGGAVSFSIGATDTAALGANAIFLVTVTPQKRLLTFPWPTNTDTAGNPSDSENQPLTIKKATNNLAAGNGTAKITVYYTVESTTP